MTSTITVAQLARVENRAKRRAEVEYANFILEEPVDDVWEVLDPLELYGDVTGEKNPSDYDLDLVRSAYEDAYYDHWREENV